MAEEAPAATLTRAELRDIHCQLDLVKDGMAAMMQIKTRLEAENTQLKQENDRLKDEVAHLARMLRGAVGEMTLEQLQLSQLERLIQGLINTSQGTLERFIEGLPPADVTDSIRTGLTV